MLLAFLAIPAALQIMPPEQASIQKWDGTWRRDSEAEIVIKSRADEVTVSGSATWGSSDPQGVKRGAINTGELDASGKPRDQVLAIGYDPDRSGFRQRRPQRHTSAPRSWSCMAHIPILTRKTRPCAGSEGVIIGVWVRNARQNLLCH
jgi:hypothetical protein